MSKSHHHGSLIKYCESCCTFIWLRAITMVANLSPKAYLLHFQFSTLMEKFAGVAILSVLILFYLVLPSPSLVSILMQVIFLTISGIYYYYFRQYLKTVPAGSTTINHYIFISFTWSVQMYLAFIHLCIVSFYTFQSSLQDILDEKPLFLCFMLNPVYLILPLCMHLLFLAGIKLFILIQPHRFLGLNHEKLWTFLKAAMVISVVIDVLCRLLQDNGIICNPKSAFFLSQFLGLNVTTESFPSKALFIPFPNIALVISCIIYLAATLISTWNTRSQQRRQIGIIAPSIEPGGASAKLSNDASVQQAWVVEAVDVSIPLQGMGNVRSITNFEREEVVRSNLVQALIHASAESDALGPPAGIQKDTRPDNGLQIIHVQSFQDDSSSSQDQREDGIQSLGVEVLQSSTQHIQSSASVPSLTLQPSKSSAQEVMKVISFGGFISGTSLLVIVIFLDIVNHQREMPKVSEIGVKIFLLVWELLPVYWIKRIPEARDFMQRHLPNLLQGVPKTLLDLLI